MTVTAAHFRTERVTTTAIPALRVMTSAPRPRAISDLTLVATSTAVSVGLLFVRYTLTEWDRPELASNGEALLSELVSQAVQLIGVPDPSTRWRDLDDLALIQLRLVLFDHAIVIEVADRHREPPNPSDAFRSLSKQWNFYPTEAGRVVWCELELPQYQLTEHGLPKRRPSPRPITQRPPTLPGDRDVLQRVREWLEEL
ncbi:hypothetical protein EV192_11916 [Actinocrispum wychmicini]|uniref:Uncharacterized protein n=2 Tax=Actinocrispum wychmicini TaxID=1213861 RepID=A0A4V2S411_9PSEU|nr:hypothetical protein EV192_11916 [Actinocrispum wychmicini]